MRDGFLLSISTLRAIIETVIDMHSIQAPATAETVVSKSRFLAVVAPAHDAGEAAALLRRLREAHPDATHHCHAYVVGPQGTDYRSSDDGEPGGTAGTPMLEVLRKAGVTDVAAVVVRWFGGVKLGAGGLARAYAGAVRAALKNAVPAEPVHFREIVVVCPLARAGALAHVLREGARILEEKHDDSARFRIRVRAEAADGLLGRIAQVTSGTASADDVGETVLYE
jgi:uncharacterized YigZ family protein